MDAYAITLSQVSVGYHGKKLICDINFSLHAGEILTIIGPNGAGKSTILKSITKQLSLLDGDICLLGKNLQKMTENQMARNMSMVSTQRLQTEMMTCREMVETGRYPYTGRLGLLTKEDKKIVENVMEKLHISNLAASDFMEISDGQRQRVMLARALCQKPKVLILDEPTSFLDIRYKVEILSLIRDMAKELQIAVVMSLHELEFARKIADYVVCVDGKHVVSAGKNEEIFTSHTIPALFGLDASCYDEQTGQVELLSQKSEPEVFVIGGAGSGITLYHRLQREKIPFAAGVLHENDKEFFTAKALAGVVISEKAFEPISEAQYQKALEIMKKCKHVICTVSEFGQGNKANESLRKEAEKLGLLEQDF